MPNSDDISKTYIPRYTIKEISLIGLFTAVIAVCAQLSVPMPYGVPMTLQTLAIPLAGLILGAKNGTVATVVYILLGAVGAPVFANFTGGIGIVFGPTGGFILSFPLMAYAAGFGGLKKSRVWLISGLVAGAAVNFACGMLFFSYRTSSDIVTAFFACVLPFIPTAIIKIILAAILGKALKAVINKNVINTY